MSDLEIVDPMAEALKLALEEADEGVVDGGMPDDDATDADEVDTDAGEMSDQEADAVDADSNRNAEKDDGKQGADSGDADSGDEVTDNRTKALQQERHLKREAVRQAKESQREAEELRKQLAAINRQMEEAKESGYEPREVVNEITADLIARMRDGDTDAIADYAEIQQRQATQRVSAGTQADDRPESEQSPNDPFALQSSDSGKQILNTLQDWSDDASQGIGSFAWDTAQAVEAELLKDPKYSRVSPEVFYKTLVDRTQEQLKAAVQSKVKSSESRMPDSLSAVGVTGSVDSDPLAMMESLEGQELLDYIEKMSATDRRKLMI